MDETEFVRQSTQDPQLQDLLRAVADEVRESVDLGNPQQFSVGGADILVFFVASALYRWAKDTLDHRRQLQQTEVLQQQTEIVSGLVKAGLPPKEAQMVVAALLKNLAQRTPDDAVVGKALNLLQ